ncbi:hypothetical protein [Lentzea nigeriaca]|uniref:hypothetical protein n=1 Tax=Lentzea nigeriaca TaxID=1128665 RepID=UPI001956A981|nr:hypothetical protein [Lentzea nigeriaca]MBM7859775.1 hypothetical protein [Lentzea nigeriaca]
MQYTWHLRIHLDGRRETVWRQWIAPVVPTALSVVGLTALFGHFHEESRPDAVGDCWAVRYEKIECSAYAGRRPRAQGTRRALRAECDGAPKVTAVLTGSSGEGKP